MMEQFDIVMDSLMIFWEQIVAFLPKMLGVILILLLGYIIAKVIKTIFVRFLKLIKFDVLTDKSGIEGFLKEGGVTRTAIDIIGALVYWLIMLIAILAALNSLGLSVASDLFNQIIMFIPNIIVAVVVLIIGLFLSRFTAVLVTSYFKQVGVDHADGFGKLAQYGILIFVVSIVLTQLNIGTEIVTNAFQLLFGAVCLALALAFGLGGRDWAAKNIDKFFGEKK